VLALLRPAEAAARRLVIAAARGLGGRTPQARKEELAASPQARKEEIVPASPQVRKTGSASAILRNGISAGIVMPPLPQASLSRPAPRTLALPLLDPLRPWGGRHRPAARSVPRISVPGYSVPFPIPAPPSPDDPIDARRLALRLQALGRVLEDLPAEARRFARWRSRTAVGVQKEESRTAVGVQKEESRTALGVQKGESRDAASAQNKEARDVGRARRVWPLRPGRPPGWRRNPAHEVHEILNVVHGLAIWALKSPDTS
jgi:hypothetical protein